MQGEFRGDFTRDTHSPQKQFLRVLMQQGRVQLDADFNEQVSILLHYLQTLATDLIGPYGGPAVGGGFEIALSPGSSDQVEDLSISTGRYYVEGLLCENSSDDASFENQPYLPVDNNFDYPNLPFLVYLDIWERHIDAIQDANPDGSIREIALGGPDTATRSQVTWQVKLTQTLNVPNEAVQGEGDQTPLQKILEFGTTPESSASPSTNESGEPAGEPEEDSLYSQVTQAAEVLRTNPEALYQALPEIVADAKLPKLKAKAKEISNSDDQKPCILSPNARYRGAENQLYRVEIHSGGDQPTFKWSRENSAVVFPITVASGSMLTLEHLGYDTRFGLQENDWVEIVENDPVYRNEPHKLLQVTNIDFVTQQVTLSSALEIDMDRDRPQQPYLRRWDHKESNPSYGGHKLASNGAIPVTLEGDSNQWQMLEDGIQVQFQQGVYRPGDYWLIPARTATGDIEWPRESSGASLAISPHGVRHYYAPLAIVVSNDGGTSEAVSCRKQFVPLPMLAQNSALTP
ncbi:MAG: DUF6519 domain-containing protein [Cyanobacteria bacterium P01_F01_bin.86]